MKLCYVAFCDCFVAFQRAYVIPCKLQCRIHMSDGVRCHECYSLRVQHSGANSMDDEENLAPCHGVRGTNNKILK